MAFDLCHLRWREREARVITAGPWPAGDSRPRSRRGPGVKPLLPIPPAPPQATHSSASDSPLNNSPAEGLAGSGRAAGLTLGGRLRTIRASLFRTQRQQMSVRGPPCHARAARRARGAERERALAGPSGGASGPWGLGLKTYRKSSPTGTSTESDSRRAGVARVVRRLGLADRSGMLEP
jgi:hypothetical protein